MRSLIFSAALTVVLGVTVPGAGASQTTRSQVTPSPVTEISHCGGQNAEVEQAVDGRYVYVTWIGCGGIGFARSTDGGQTFGKPLRIPGSAGQGLYTSGPQQGISKAGWDPAIAVAPDHTVYVSYMMFRHGHIDPSVASSSNHGASFPKLTRVVPTGGENWGDRDFIAVSKTGTIYLTWDYGPSLRVRHGNIVIQKSADGGATWSPRTVVTPGYPDHSGGVGAPLVIEPGGRIDAAFWLWGGGAVAPYALPPNHIYFTSSSDEGRTWSRPVAIRPDAGRSGYFVTWIDVDLSIDAAGTLYATWDTQIPGDDIGWLSYSTDHGRTWSRAVRVTPDNDHDEHIMAVASGPPGVVYCAWLSDGAPQGYAQYVRVYSVRSGWLTAPIMVSRQYGNRNVWPGDTIGISLLSPGGKKLQISWGSQVHLPDSEIYTATVSVVDREEQPVGYP